MEEVLSLLSEPLVIGVIIIILIFLIAFPILLRRRRSAADEELPELDAPIDYTSLPVEERPRLRDRITNLSLAGKILLGVIPLLFIVGIILLLLILPQISSTAQAPTATPTPLQITDATAILARVNPQQIQIEADSTLTANTTEVRAELFLNDEPFPWYQPATAITTVRTDGTIQLSLTKAENGPPPQRDVPIMAILRADIDGQEIVSEPFTVDIPEIYASQFYAGAVAEVPTPDTEPTEEAPEPTTEITPTVEVTATATPSIDIASGLAATVTNGGNVRQHPMIIENVIGTINADEQIEILGQTPNGEWFLIRNARDEIGWTSATLLSIEPSVLEQVPVESVVTVFVSGNIYEQPQEQSNTLGQVFINETVELSRKTPAGDWYEVTSVRDETGWVSASLLGIPPEVAEQVPVQQASSGATSSVTDDNDVVVDENETPVPDTTIEPDAATPLAGLVVNAFNRGSVRDQPNLEGAVLGAIEAGEQVELLERTQNASWYRINSAQGITGWISSSLLRLDQEIVDRVPVASEGD